MPACYAHYRFGAAVIPLLPEKIRSCVKRSRQVYDIGVHGPDIFFYHNPFVRTPTVELGYAFHKYSGKDFFTGAARKVRLASSDRAIAYLFGVLSHYALDAHCHPLIVDWNREGISPHVATESEFDRFLLEKDGKIPPHRQDLSRHLHFTPKDLSVISNLYGVPRLKVAQSCENFIRFTRILCPTGKISRDLVEKGIHLVPGVKDFLIPAAPDPRCSHLDAVLLEQYEKAEAVFPELARQLAALLESGTPLSEAFDPIFG